MPVVRERTYSPKAGVTDLIHPAQASHKHQRSDHRTPCLPVILSYAKHWGTSPKVYDTKTKWDAIKPSAEIMNWQHLFLLAGKQSRNNCSPAHTPRGPQESWGTDQQTREVPALTWEEQDVRSLADRVGADRDDLLPSRSASERESPEPYICTNMYSVSSSVLEDTCEALGSEAEENQKHIRDVGATTPLKCCHKSLTSNQI